ncbi:TetR/AcrR family transcriptional regulator [Cupriavidus plantarum]|uniref:TetR/AcrR family transcriptional regulator n=1 Tax=Cupriavidus plantarum TaxID=942865 RepID=UPI000EAFC66B|nr:TetR/AcrR family transcriptional regulator [Cupriavidus plantarum]RLK30023.1 TetR family transcriptional regulator [Cupriavidus plantarum]
MASRGRPRAFDREAALARAMNVFWEKGFDSASMGDLTSAMGIGSPSLYAAFHSKEALFRDALALYVKTDGASVWLAVQNAESAYEAAEQFLMESARAFTRQGKPAGCLVVLSAAGPPDKAAEGDKGDKRDEGDDVRAVAIKRRRECERYLARKLKAGVQTGEIAPSTDIDTLAAYLMTIQQGMSMQARSGMSRHALLKIAKAALAGWDSLTTASSRIEAT